METKSLYAKIFGTREDNDSKVNLSIMKCPHCQSFAQPNVSLPTFSEEDIKKYKNFLDVNLSGSWPVSLRCFKCGVTMSLPYKIKHIVIHQNI